MVIIHNIFRSIADKTMKTRLTASTLILVFSLHMGGCASIVTGQDQLVSVTTPNCPGSACTLKNEEGTYYVHQTPGNVSVDREYGDLIVTCTKLGNAPFSMNVSSSTKGMAFGNILLGGGIGAIVDAGTGAAYDYPDEIVVPIDCRSPEELAAAPKSGSYDAEAAKPVNLNVCEYPIYVLNDASGEIYKSRCQDGNVGVIRCNDGQCIPLNVASKADDTASSNNAPKTLEPKHKTAANAIATDRECAESVVAVDVTEKTETWMAKCDAGKFVFINCEYAGCSVRE